MITDLARPRLALFLLTERSDFRVYRLEFRPECRRAQRPNRRLDDFLRESIRNTRRGVKPRKALLTQPHDVEHVRRHVLGKVVRPRELNEHRQRWLARRDGQGALKLNSSDLDQLPRCARVRLGNEAPRLRVENPSQPRRARRTQRHWHRANFRRALRYGALPDGADRQLPAMTPPQDEIIVASLALDPNALPDTNYSVRMQELSRRVVAHRAGDRGRHVRRVQRRSLRLNAHVPSVRPIEPQVAVCEHAQLENLAHTHDGCRGSIG